MENELNALIELVQNQMNRKVVKYEESSLILVALKHKLVTYELQKRHQGILVETVQEIKNIIKSLTNININDLATTSITLSTKELLYQKYWKSLFKQVLYAINTSIGPFLDLCVKIDEFKNPNSYFVEKEIKNYVDLIEDAKSELQNKKNEVNLLRTFSLTLLKLAKLDATEDLLIKTKDITALIDDYVCAIDEEMGTDDDADLVLLELKDLADQLVSTIPKSEEKFAGLCAGQFRNLFQSLSSIEQ